MNKTYYFTLFLSILTLTHTFVINAMDMTSQQYQCYQCGETFSSSQGLGSHNHYKHGLQGKKRTHVESTPESTSEESESEQPVFVCKICNRACGSPAGLGAHMRVHSTRGSSRSVSLDPVNEHQVLLSSGPGESSSPTDAMSPSSSSTRLASRTARPNIVPSALDDDDTSESSEEYPMCKKCFWSFGTRKAFQRHNRKYANMHQNWCPHCQIGFETHAILQYHIERMHREELEEEARIKRNRRDFIGSSRDARAGVPLMFESHQTFL